MKWNFELEIVINDIANTVPGIAYPIPAGNVKNFLNKNGRPKNKSAEVDINLK